MKKILTVLLTAAMLLSVASCGNNETENTTTEAPAVTDAPETEATESETEAPEAETEAPEAETEAPEAETEDAPAEEGEAGTAASESQRLAEVVLNSGVEFPAVMPVEDPAIITDVLCYDMTDAEEYSVTMQLMSAHLIEVVIIKPVDGKMDAVMEMLNARKDQLLNSVAFYPDQVESAEGTVVGNKGGYAYLICHKDGAKAEEALLNAIA